jgi:hypothetical protein
MPKLNLEIQLDSSKIKKKDFFRWADFVELSCLLDDLDGQAFLGEVLSEPWGFESGFAGMFTEDDSSDDFSDERPGYEDQVESKLRDLLYYLQSRQKLLGNYYPFEVNNQDNSIKLKKIEHSHILYVYLLCAANLSFVKQVASDLTTGFERLAYHVVKKIMSDQATVKLFGTAKTTGYESYTGSKYCKIKKLASDLNARISSDISKNTYSANDTGDDGLDIAAWVPFKDNVANQLLILAQAGCTCDENEMLNKQYGCDPDKWKNKIPGITPISMMITPVCYRNTEGKWVNPTNVISVFIDRIRVMQLLADFVPELKNKSISSLEDIFENYKDAR